MLGRCLAKKLATGRLRELTQGAQGEMPANRAAADFSRPRDLIVLLCALVVVHIPLLLNDGLFGEDWLLFEIKPGYPTQPDFLLHGAGHPFLYAYCALANLSGHPIAFMKALALAGILIGATNLRGFLLRLRRFSSLEATMFAFLVWSYAGFQDWATKLTATYVLSMALLCVGLNILAQLISHDRPRPMLRLCGLAAIFLSFSLNSLITAYLVGLCAALIAAGSDQESGMKAQPRRIIVLALRFVDFLAVPVVYWISINHFFPKAGPYRDYYLMRIPSVGELLSRLSDFWQWGYIQLARDGLFIARAMPKLIIPALVIGATIVLLASRSKRDKAGAPTIISVIWPLTAALLAFVACAAPYIVSGIGPNGHFYESRHLILFGIPLALALIAGYRLVSRVAGNDALGNILAGAAITLNICALWNGYFFQEARWLRQAALIDDLHRKYPEPPAAVFNLSDGFLDFGRHTFFGITEITGALHAAWDSRPLFGFTGRHERPTILQEMDEVINKDGSAFRNMDIWGPQATIDFVPKPPVLTYYGLSVAYYRCLIGSCGTEALTAALGEATIRVGMIANLAPPSPQ
jgi:hypothetical protein